MTEAEAKDTFEQLSHILTEAKMGWIVSQVTEQIALGRLETKKLRSLEITASEDSLLVPFEQHRKTGTFTRTREYTPREQVSLLVDAIEQVWVYSPQMENATATVLAGETTDAPGRSEGLIVEFASEDQNERYFKSTRESRGRKEAIASKLKPLISELREAINAN